MKCYLQREKNVQQKNMELSRKGDYNMKKIITLVCMITCIFGLTACGSKTIHSEYDEQKMNYAKQIATQGVIPLLATFMDVSNENTFDEYTAEEVEYVIGQDYSLNVKGYPFKTAVKSFATAYNEVGTITEIGEAKAEIDGHSIIVRVEVIGDKEKAEAEVIFSNDMFMVVESAALNPETSTAQMMTRAALNTVIGISTVFGVLILISFIISLFIFIPKIQALFERKDDEKEEVQKESITNTIAQIVEKEENVELSDDLELVAVITAAIAASEGAQKVEGFVVRSIRKINKR